MPNPRALRTNLALLLAGALCLLAACAGGGRLPPPGPAAIRQQASVGELSVLLDSPADPVAGQPQHLRVHLRDPRGRPVGGAVVSLRLAMPMLCASGGTLPARETGPGTYDAEASYEMSGAWTVEVAVAGPAAGSATFAAQVREDPALALLNPYADDMAAAELGAALYAGSCARCHGDGGRGDGPDGAGLTPPPADLTAHMAPGKHSDGEVFRWIRDGVPGGAMPAFGSALSADDRWRLVSYLRALAAGPVAPTGAPLPPLVFVRAGNLLRSDGASPSAEPIPGTAGLGSFRSPAFSPDGQWLAVIARRTTAVSETGRFAVPTLYLLRPDGGELRPLWDAPDEELSDVAWTADGAALVVTAQTFTALGDGGGTLGPPRLVRVDRATGARATLLADAESPAFARDGGRLAFVQRDAALTLRGLAVAGPDGQDARIIVDGARFELIAAPRFAPDGRQVVFAASGGPPVDAAGRPVAARAPTLLGRLGGLLAPATALAHGGQWEIWSVQADGAGLRRLTALATHDPVAAFSPDGAQLVVASEEGLHLMRSDGGDVRLLDPAMALGGVDWAPAP